MEVIHNIPQLIHFLETNYLSSTQICQILHEGFQIIGDDTKKPSTLIQEIKDYWEQYQSCGKEKPIFLGLDIDVKEENPN